MSGVGNKMLCRGSQFTLDGKCSHEDFTLTGKNDESDGRSSSVMGEWDVQSHSPVLFLSPVDVGGSVMGVRCADAGLILANHSARSKASVDLPSWLLSSTTNN